MTLLIEAPLAILAAVLNYRIARRSKLVAALLTVWTTLSLCTTLARRLHLSTRLPYFDWIHSCGLLWFLSSAPLAVAFAGFRKSSKLDAGRRVALRTGASLALAPAGAFLFAICNAQTEARVREVALPVFDLPADLAGIRLVQISDIHLSPFYSRSQLRRVVDQANGLNADLMLITGDLITSRRDPLQDAIAELARLRSIAGMYGCLGNHEIFAGAEHAATRAGLRIGLKFLRSEAVQLRFGNAEFNLAGVDHQPYRSTYLENTGSLLQPGLVNVLLSHNPDVFPVAARQGWDVTLAGHTHGGQITLEYLHPALNPARFNTPFVKGTYQIGRSSIFVTNGLGTVDVPARLGSNPEIALIRLIKA